MPTLLCSTHTRDNGKIFITPWHLVTGAYQHPKPLHLVFPKSFCILISNRILNKSLLLSSHCKGAVLDPPNILTWYEQEN